MSTHDKQASRRLLTTRLEFHDALHEAFAEMASTGCREVFMSDEDFADWPLNTPRVIDALNGWAEIHAAFPGLSQDDCLETMHVVTASGQVKTGFDAYRAISWSIPLFWPIAPLLYVPGVPLAGRRVYARVARNRHRAGCPVPERSAAP